MREEAGLHDLLDFRYGADGEEALRRMLEAGADPNERRGPSAETALHVATRRRRAGAVAILLERGADIDARTKGGKTAYAHAIRRGFHEIAAVLARRGAGAELSDADRFAVAVAEGNLVEAQSLLRTHPGVARTGNPEEDRLLADMAGRNDERAVRFLVDAGADLTARGLDSGTALHQAAWFGQPGNARLLIDAGAPLDVFEDVHQSSPLHWAVHGSRWSGGAEERQDAYVAVVKMLLEAGSSRCYPHDPQGDAYRQRLLRDASSRVRVVLEQAMGARRPAQANVSSEDPP